MRGVGTGGVPDGRQSFLSCSYPDMVRFLMVRFLCLVYSKLPSGPKLEQRSVGGKCTFSLVVTVKCKLERSTVLCFFP